MMESCQIINSLFYLICAVYLFKDISCYIWSLIRSRTTSPKGKDRSPESNVPRSICLKILCSLSPTPMMLHIKFDQDWPTGFRDIQVQKCEILVTQGQVTPYWTVWFGPKSNSTELLCLSWWLPETLKMIRSKMNELAWRHHFPIIGLYEKCFRRSRAVNSVVSDPIWPKFELVRDFMQVQKGSNQRQPRKGGDTIFPIISQWGLLCCHGHQSFDPICLKTLCSLSPPPDATHKIWSKLASKIFKFGSVKFSSFKGK